MNGNVFQSVLIEVIVEMSCALLVSTYLKKIIYKSAMEKNQIPWNTISHIFHIDLL